MILFSRTISEVDFLQSFSLYELILGEDLDEVSSHDSRKQENKILNEMTIKKINITQKMKICEVSKFSSQTS